MKRERRPGYVPLEVSAVVGAAMAASGLWLVIVGSAVVWGVLNRVRKSAQPNIKLVASVLTTGGLVAFWAPGTGSNPLLLLEPISIALVALLLLFTEWPILAWLLILHSCAVIVNLAVCSSGVELTAAEQQVMLGTVVLRGTIIWVLATFLRSRSKGDASAAGVQETTTGSADNILPEYGPSPSDARQIAD